MVFSCEKQLYKRLRPFVGPSVRQHTDEITLVLIIYDKKLERNKQQKDRLINVYRHSGHYDIASSGLRTTNRLTDRRSQWDATTAAEQ